MNTNEAPAKSDIEEKPLPTSKIFELIDKFTPTVRTSKSLAADTEKFLEELKSALDSLSQKMSPREETTSWIEQLEEKNEKLSGELSETEKKLESIRNSLERIESFVESILENPDAALRRKLRAFKEALERVKKDGHTKSGGVLYIQRTITTA